MAPQEDPYGAIIADYSFDLTPQDLALLQPVAQVAAAAHCPFVAAVGWSLFHSASSGRDASNVPDLKASPETDAYQAWNAFLDTEAARYVGLTLPRFLLRQPYTPETVRSLVYLETASEQGCNLGGNAAFAFAVVMVRAFAEDGLCVQISGPYAGGRVEINGRLPLVLPGIRFMHYLKTIRKVVGIANREQLQKHLQTWIQGYVSPDPEPSEHVVRRRPLKVARVRVLEDDAGVLRLELSIIPHRRAAGLRAPDGPDVTIRLADPVDHVAPRSTP